MLRRLLGERVELATELDPGLGYVNADPAQLEQVIVNLALNARDAMPDGGRLTIATRETSVSDVEPEHAMSPGDYVVLSVSDTGSGMSPEVQQHVFEPFFTTKAEAGTGMGLAMVYGIVKQSGGYVWCDSVPGKGTTFTIYLPRVGAPAHELPAPTPASLPRGSETILLVEDEAFVRHVVREMLESCGYEVVEAANGEDALAADEGHAVDLLVTDVVMPGMTGAELARRLGERRPGLKAIYMSGYTDDALGRHGVLEDGIAFLQKPFTVDLLAHKVRDVLGAREAAA
jgi:CheY-like chemotaxis protein